MNLRNVYLNTLIPEIPVIIKHNNDQIKNYLDLFYNESQGIIVVPVNTQGRVKGSSGEFVNLITDNLTVKNQYTNLYDNNTTADYNYYKMYNDPATLGIDPCTYGIDTSVWSFPYEPVGYKIVNVNKPYYKITNEYPVFLANDNLSQVVGIYFDTSLAGPNPLQVLLDPCVGTLYQVDTAEAGAYKEFICVKYDSSWGSTWIQYK